MSPIHGTSDLSDQEAPTQLGPSRPRSHRGIILVSALVSIGAHVAILQLQVHGPGANDDSAHPFSPTLQELDEPIRVIRLGTPRPPEVGITFQTVEVVEFEPTFSPLDPPGPGAEHGPDEGPGHVRDRLVPRAGDLRYWRPVRIQPKRRAATGPGDGFAEALAAILDSVAAEEARLAEANEWSHADGKGRVWGASPGTLHLGLFDLPLCGGNFSSESCGFGVAPGKLIETLERRRVHSRIDQSAFRQSMGKYWADRASKMNARKEEARRAKGRSGG